MPTIEAVPMKKKRRRKPARYTPRPHDICVRVRCQGHNHLIIYRTDDRKLILVDHDKRHRAAEDIFNVLGGNGDMPRCREILQAWRDCPVLGRLPSRRDLSIKEVRKAKENLPDMLFKIRVQQKKNTSELVQDPLVPPTGLDALERKRWRLHSPLLVSRVFNTVKTSDFYRHFYARCGFLVERYSDTPYLTVDSFGVVLHVMAGEWLCNVHQNGLFPLGNLFVVRAELFSPNTGVVRCYGLSGCGHTSNHQLYRVERAAGGAWIATPFQQLLI